MIRITGGEFRGRPLRTPKGSSTRPTQARLRQALFNSLQAVIPGARVLDLFAGSGALGFEALSRGSASVVFVEEASAAARLIDANARDLRVTNQIRVLAAPLERVRPELLRQGPFDLVLADPPYAGGWELKLLETFPWEQLLVPEGFFCLEWGAQKSKLEALPERSGQLVKVREKNYGDSVLSTFERLAGQSEAQ